MPRGQDIPLSWAQQRLWFLEQLEDLGSTYHMPATMRLRGMVDREALQRSLDAILARHEALRTVFVRNESGKPVQRVLPEQPFALAYHDLSGLGQQEREQAKQALTEETLHRPFDLTQDILIRASLVKLQEKEHILNLCMHHIVSDGWSMGVLTRELAALYEAFSQGQVNPLPALPIQYVDYAQWQRQWLSGERLERQVAFWKEELAGAPSLLELPTDRPRPPLQRFEGGMVPFELDEEITQGLNALARRHGATLFMVLQAGFAVLLGRLSGQDDVVIGTPVANRRRSELEGLIGFFVNTLALRTRLNPQATVAELLGQVRERTLAGFGHQDVPFEQVVEAVSPERNMSHSALFQVMMALQNAPEGEVRLPALTLGMEESGHGTTHFDLTLSLSESKGGLQGGLEYSTVLFDRETVERWLGHLTVLLEAMVADETCTLAQLPLLTEPEREQLVHGFNATEAAYPGEALIHELFEQQVGRAPEALAVEYEDERLTYAQLNARANQLAHRLRGLKDASGAPLVGPDALVAISVERSLEMVVGLLGILKSGAAYVPVDPEYPADRIAYMLRDSQAKVLLTQRALQERLQAAVRAEDGVEAAGRSTGAGGDGQSRTGAEGAGTGEPAGGTDEILLLDDGATYAGQPEDNIGREETDQTSRHLAYVIYTSGSTGHPKGAMNEHRGVVNRLVWKPQGFSLDRHDRFLQKTAFGFDVSVFEFFWPLLNGAGLVMARPGGHQDPVYLAEVIEKKRITAAHFVPSVLQVMLEHVGLGQCSSLAHLFSGGEPLAASLRDRVRKVLPHSRLYNVYGPAEAAIDVTCWVCDGMQDEGVVPIGRPISNIRIYILDQEGQPAPIGVTGEIHVAGAGVARGYLNRPGLTKERFFRDPFSAGPFARMYRTGDLGRWRSDGAIEYLGRNDFQVKIRGLRIELGEIEARLAELPAVREVVVLAREAGQTEPDRDEGTGSASGTGVKGDKRLVAYWVARDGLPEADVPTVEKLRDHLKAGLPAYMVPSAFVKLEAMPLTPNGKVDRKALPAPDAEALVTHAYEAPQGPVEEVLAGIWQELLGVERVGRHDSFFDLGGHSLMIVSMVEKLRKVGMRVEIRQVFQSLDLAELAAEVRREEAEEWQEAVSRIPEGCARITPEMISLVVLTQQDIDRVVKTVPGGAANVQDIYPLAPLQEGVLFYHRFHPDRDPYVLSFTLTFESQQKFERFADAMNRVIARHDALRTAILWEGLPQPLQVVYRHAELPVEPMEIPGEGEASACIRGYLENASLGMDLGKAPLISLRPVHFTGRNERICGAVHALVVFHHVISDHVSMDVMVDEIAQILDGNETLLPEPISYRRFVAQGLNPQIRDESEAFFRGQFGDVDGQTAPFGLMNVHGDGSDVAESTLHLEDGLSGRIRACTRRLGVSAAALFHVAYGLLLAKCSSRDDVVFGSVLSGRMGSVMGADRMVGMFINTLPVRARQSGVDVLAATETMQNALVELLRYEQTPLADVQRVSSLSGDTSLFSAVLNYRHSRVSDDMTGRLGIVAADSRERTNYPMMVSVDDLGEGFALTAQTQARVVEPERVLGYMSCAVAEVVDALEHAPHRELLSLGVVPQAEKEQVVHGFNATEAEYPRQALIHELFEQQVERTPEALAVQYEGESLTYAQLNAKANQLARCLRGLKDASGAPLVGPDALVAISVERSLEMVVGLLGILKAGAAYVPVDPEYPADRIAYMLGDSQAKVLLTQRTLQERLQEAARGDDEGSGEILLLDDEATYAGQPQDNIGRQETGQTSRHLAYVIYTSGSTGQPKGVMNEHRGVVNRLVWMQEAYGLGEEDRVLQKTPFSFDVSVWEFFWTLLNGAGLVMAAPQGHRDAQYLVDVIERAGVTVVHFVPSMLQVFLASVQAGQCASLRQMVCSGEELPLALQQRCQERLPSVPLDNLYGPTEAAVDVTWWPCDPAQTEGRVPIGRPISNIRMYVLDEQRQPVPLGVAGELYIGGDGVARGYLNREELTAERFVRDPFSEEAEARMYRTGDLGRWRPDGAIEYLGRNDFQVKIRGQRIELGEIEARLAELPQVREAVVLARQDSPGDQRLVAYWTARDEGAAGAHDAAAAVDAADAGDDEHLRQQQEVARLRDHLKAELPAYMVPSAFVRLETMPLTPNGKVDRKALPAPDAGALVTHAYEAPQGPVEEVLAGIWQELLGVARVGRHDSFFDLGGHSLLAVQLIGRMRRELGQEVALKDFFGAPTIEGVAGSLAQADELLTASIEAADRTKDLALSWAQQRLWFLEQLEDLGSAYHISGVLRLQGELDREALQGSLDEILARHEALRTVFVRTDDGEPVQRILPVQPFALAYHDLSQLAEAEKEQARASLTEETLHRPFDLTQDILIRASLAKLGEQDHVLNLCMHHIVSDGWSMGVLTRELGALYEAFSQGQENPLPALPIQYVDYAQWQRQWLSGERLERQVAFWKEELSGVPSLLDLPTDHPRPQVQSFAGSVVPFELDEEITQGLNALARRHGATLFMVLQAGFAVLLGRLSGQDDVVIGTPVANRRRSELEGLIGFFVNTLTLCTRLDPEATVAELLAQVRERTLAGYGHQDVPFEQVVEAVSPERDMSHSPLFQVMLALQNNAEVELKLPGLTLGQEAFGHDTTHFDLTLSLGEADGRLQGMVEYSTVLFERATVERWLGHLRVLLSAMVADEACTLAGLPLLTEPEREQVIHGFNATEAVYPKDALIHELFEQQVERTPDALAVRYEDAELTYAALNARANQLAHWLLDCGAGRGQCVASAAPRGIPMLLAQLATLKAGGTYVPIDPAFPQERRLFMLQDCRAKVVLSGDAAVEAEDAPEAGQDVQWLDLGHALEAVASLPTDNPAVPKAECAEAAYVMYTSGSTGQPKGVMAPHRGVNRLVFANGYADITPEDVLAHFSNPAFDGSTFETWGALLNGARVVIVPQETVLDPVRFGQLLLDEGVTTMFMTIGLFHQYADVLAEPLSRLKYLLTGGDVIEPNTIRRVLKYGAPENFMAAYGPTETTTFATTCRLNDLIDEGSQKIPLGRPIGNTQVYILDGQGEPVPIGVTGEIHIGGDGVALGYLNRPDLTAERFIPDPFSDAPDARMYRTGDLGYWRADGLIEFVGRNDFQVKVRGFRIELGEIEARLGELAEVKEVVVLAREDQLGDKRLVAYWTARDEDAADRPDATGEAAETGGDEGTRLQQEVARLREHLRAELPEYMVPSAFVRLEAMPLNTSGKVDRKALPAPDAEALVTHAYEAPQGPVEEVLAGIWQELLGVERVGRHDSFFDLGGHSLLAVQLIGRMRRDLGQEVALKDFFGAPTIAEVAGSLAQADESLTAPIVSADRTKDLALSWAQQRLWFLEQFEDLGSAYHIPAVLRLQGGLDREALQRSLDAILSRHEALRTVFVRNEVGDPVQRILPVQPFALAYHDLSQLAEAEKEQARASLTEETLHRPFDLTQDILIRVSLAKLGEQDHVLNLCMHHIVSDGWSMGVLTRELAALYGAFSQGQENPLPALPIQYVDYAQWQRQWLSGERLKEQVSFWKEELSGAPSLLELPTDHPRPQVQSFAGSMVPFELDEEITQGLNALARRHGATLFMVLQAGFAVLLGRLSGQDDVVVGTPVANRRRSELEGLIGFFVNTLALRTRLDGQATVAELLAQVKDRTLAGFGHQDVPFEQVVEAVSPERDMSHSPLFQVMLALQNNAEVELKLPGLTLGLEEANHETTHFDLTLSLGEAEGRLQGMVEYSTVLFERATVERWLGHLRVLLSAMVADEACTLARLPLLTEPEREQVIHGFNATQAAYPKDALIHELFEQQVERTPEALAVQYEDERLTYAQLNAKANQLAHRLRAMKGASGAPVIKPDALVAISVERSLEMVVGLLGILKAGAAYVPIDPSYPAERLRYVLQDSKPVAFLTHGLIPVALREQLQDVVGGVPVIELDASSELWQEPERENLSSASMGLQPSHLAYVIYTSGSTGKPKGVMVEHQNVARLFAATQDWFHFGSGDVWTLFHSFAFDFSVWEIWGALLHGGRLVVVPYLVSRSPDAFYGLLCDEGVTVLNQTPSAFRQLMAAQETAETQRHRLRTVIFGGEALEPTMLGPWYEREQNRDTQLVNMYGITETTVHVTYRPLNAEDVTRGNSSPIGVHIPDLRIYVLDANRQPVPLGVTGELYVGGAGVARGYLNREELTAERFVDDPFSEEPGARMYRTGDLGRRQADGSLEYQGRNDFQVKIRGLRIELGEIEARLAELPAVREVVVLAREAGRTEPGRGEGTGSTSGTGVTGDRRLVAYWVARDGLPEADVPTVEVLRDHLKAELPAYMVPSAFVRLDAMPLTPNGKVDRKALPAPDVEALVTHAYEAPQGPVEEVLAGTWQDLLGVERVGRHDSFFDLGGHSLLAVQLIGRMRRDLGQEVALKDFFGAPTIAEVAGSLAQADESLTAPIELADRTKDLALSWAQQRLWFLEQLEDLASAYHMPGVLRLQGELDREALQRTLDEILARHEVLRTVFVRKENGEPVQRILPAQPFALAYHDLSQLAEVEREQAKQALTEETLHRPFDLTQDILIRASLAKLGEQDHVLNLCMHHIVSDGWSMGVLTRELAALYGAFSQGHENPLPALPIQYADYAQWQRQWLSGERLGQQVAYWKEELSGAPSLLELPTDHPRPQVQSFAGSMVPFELDEDVTQGLNALARRHGATLFMVLQAGFAVLLGRLSGQDDVVVGTPVANRRRSELEGLIGFFVNTLALRTKLDPQATVAELLAQVRERTLAGYGHQDVPFEQVVEAVSPERDMSHSPLFQVMLVLQNNAEVELKLPGLTLGMEEFGHETTHFDLTLSLGEAEGRLQGMVEYGTALFERETVERWLGHLKVLLSAMVADDACTLAELPLLTEPERERVIHGFNTTQAAYPKDALIHELFERQVERTPEALAVQYEGQSLTYSELNAKANQLAHRLRSLKDASGAPLVGPDALVAISVERSLEMVVGLLGILKAGAAYVPVDPEYPADRIAYMLRDSQAKVLLTQRTLQERLQAAARVVDGSGPGISRPEDAGGVGESGAGAEGADAEGTGETAGGPGEVLLLDEESTYAGQPQDNIGREETGQTSRHLAYVIYTSGSTGRPKGVELAHGGVCNLATLQKAALGIDTSSRVLQFASFSFDACAWEVVMSLSHGASLHLSTKARLMPGEPLCALLQERGITHVTLPPTALSALGSPEGLECLKTLVAVGEACPPQLAQQWCSRTHFINAYGPTEGTVCATMYHVPPDWMPASGQGVPIGGPVANARIYILDEQKQPVPMGVTGEIYIGGDGVARGYLNREELTAERFVRDPFSDDPAARMYRSGDLGRWRADGTIEYQGRNDFQVKIRGFRIELGEIEARLAGLPAVREVLVVARGEAGQTGQGREDAASVPGATGDKRLVAYWVARQGLPEAEVPTAEVLRNHLKAELPPYMVPSAFVKLDEMPLTPNGKVDRKALPAPDAEALVTHAYEAPQGLVEEVLAGIWQELLGVERVGRHDNFFDLGGHSLLILQLLVNVQKRLGREIDLQTFYRVPSVAAMAGLIQVGAGPDDSNSTWEQMQRDAVLDPGLVAEAPPVVEVDAVRQVLLTGATGFLGAFVLRELQRRTSAHVTCVVRARDAGHGLQRLRDSLKRYVLEEDIEFDRLEVVTGDLSLPSLGLEEDVYEGLCERMDAIYHCGAYVNHLMPYEQMQQANVEGTRELIRMAARHHAKYLNFVSTTSVLTPEDAAGREMLRESSLPRHGEHLHGGYVQTKWVAERLVEQARERGIPVSIHRAGRVSGDSEHGACQLDDSFWGVVRAIAVLGAAPEREFGETLTAVDQIAAAIVVLSQSAVLCNRTWHPVALGVSDRAAILAALRRGGYTIREVSDRVWRDEALRFFEAHPDDPSARLGAFLFKSAGSGHQDAPVREAVPVSSAVTRDAAQALGVELLPASVDMLDRSVSYFKAVGFLPA